MSIRERAKLRVITSKLVPSAMMQPAQVGVDDDNFRKSKKNKKQPFGMFHYFPRNVIKYME